WSPGGAKEPKCEQPLSPLRGSRYIGCRYPRLTPWATVFRPYRGSSTIRTRGEIATMRSGPSRRRFFKQITAATGGTALGAVLAEAAVPTDAPRDLKPTAANLGSLFPDVAKLAADNRYAYSFLGDRFKTLDEFKKAGREKVFEAALYRPEKVEPKAEVVERVDQGDFIREKILFSTGPHFRVPAYVLIPKKVKTPAPAMVDLHSHGGMF